MHKNLPYWLIVVALMLIASSGAVAQANGNPQDPNAVTLKPWGKMHGMIDQCRIYHNTEGFGQSMFALGDIDRSGTADFIIARNRCDTIVYIPQWDRSYLPEELLLYRGVRGGVPQPESGERIGPAEIGSATRLLASGDWDGDGHRDLAVSLAIFGDTSSGNTVGAVTPVRVIVLWGQPNGGYTFNDTTQLSCGADVWLNIKSGASLDMNNDGVSDLVVESESGYSAAARVPLPRLHLFAGTLGRRWGRSGVSNRESWYWWGASAAFTDELYVTDQDCDGLMDLVGVFTTGMGGATGVVGIVYGSRGSFPDTLEARSVSLAVANGKYVQFCDVTGDGVPELCVSAGSEDKIKIYAGKPGQRLLEQYGTGIDPPDPEHGRPYARPWAEIWQPHKINDGWFSGGFLPLFAPGDLNGDGYCELCAMAPPLLVCYSTGKFMDSLFDAAMLAPDYTNMVVLGDIDGSGKSSIAVRGVNEVVFLKGDANIPTMGGDIRTLPHAEGFRCDHATGVELGRAVTGSDVAVDIIVLPNPTVDDVDLYWTSDGTGAITLVISNGLGQDLYHLNFLTGTNHYRWSTRGWSRGVYWLRVQQGSRLGVRRIVVQ